MRFPSALAVMGCCLLADPAPRAAAAPEPAPGFITPEGFTLTLYAGDDLAHNLSAMTIDPQGRVVVAGRDDRGGFIKTLHDDNGDGVADRATLFAPRPRSSAHGLCFDGQHLIATGDDSVMRLLDADGDGVADQPDRPEVWARLAHPEHGANGVVKGPDGAIYVICGNDAGVARAHANLPTSPVREPHMGALVRFAPDTLADKLGWRPGERPRPSEVLAHGFRNPYDLCLDAEGQFFTVDADGERDHHLPWYAPTRLFDVAIGGHHGWVIGGWTRSWSRPAHFLDSTPRLLELGRGSPTGLVCYRHRQFPKAYQGGIFYSCWTLGRVYFFPLTRSGAGYQSESRVFVETQGDTGFAPVDLAVGPQGDLFIAVGGRGTRGGVFRLRFDSGHPLPALAREPLLEVLEADDPLSAWSRAAWVPQARKLGAQAFIDAALNPRLATAARVRAIEVLTELFEGLPFAAADELVSRHELGRREVLARLAWSLGLAGEDPRTPGVLVRLALSRDGAVARAAYESLLRRPATSPLDLGQLASSPWSEGADRRMRDLAAVAHRAGALARGEPPPSALSLAMALPDRVTTPIRNTSTAVRDLRQALPQLLSDAEGRALLAGLACDLWPLSERDPHGGTPPAERRLALLRFVQLALGDVRVKPIGREIDTGYAATDPDALPDVLRQRLVRTLAPSFPSEDPATHYELARTLAMLRAEHDGLMEALAAQITDESSPTDDLHHLLVLAQLPGARSPAVTPVVAQAFAALHGKMRGRSWHVAQNWPTHVADCLASLAARDPKLADALIDHPLFGESGHAAWVQAFSGPQRDRAIAALVRRLSSENGGAGWTAEAVRLAATAPEAGTLAALRAVWDRPALRDEVALAVARSPEASDRQHLIESLRSPRSEVVAAAAGALDRLGGRGSGAELGQALRALRRHLDAGASASARRALASLLARWSGQAVRIDEPAGKPSRAELERAYAPWFTWFAGAYPELAGELETAGGATPAAWKERLAKIDWSTGDALRGEKVFAARSCHLCHGEQSRLGPELTGAADRYSVMDLFAQIIDPSASISPLYQTREVMTKDGRRYVGLVVYDSPEGTLLTVGPGQQARIRGEEFAGMRPSAQSLMPTGLIDGLSDGELADLYRYLKSLKPGSK